MWNIKMSNNNNRYYLNKKLLFNYLKLYLKEFLHPSQFYLAKKKNKNVKY